MITQTSFSGTPDDLKRMLMEVVNPLTDRMRELEIAAGSRKHAYTVAEVAELISYSTKSVLGFIHKGRPDRRGKTIKLGAKEVTNGDYRITPVDLDRFLSHF